MELSGQMYGPLQPFVDCDTVTDINYNGRRLWIDDLVKGRYCAGEVVVEDRFLKQFSMHLANRMNCSFNPYHPILEAETSNLRISVIHESVTNTGCSLSIRKTPALRRISRAEMERSGFCSQELDTFMENCVRAGMSILIAGLPGAGKTEYLKYLTQFIPEEQKVITVEDNLEIHYTGIDPNKDGIELKVGDTFSYAQAIKASMRQLPSWLILSEARSREVEYLLEAMSTGVSCMTTIHTDDVRKIPDRICSMAKADVLNEVYTFVDIGILVGSYHLPDGGIQRRLEQAVLYDRNQERNQACIFYEQGAFKRPSLSEAHMRKFQYAGISQPFAGRD